jgi:hypothetical protein
VSCNVSTPYWPASWTPTRRPSLWSLHTASFSLWHATQIIDRPTQLTVRCVNKNVITRRRNRWPIAEMLLFIGKHEGTHICKHYTRIHIWRLPTPLLSESALQVDATLGRTHNRSSNAREILFNRLKLSSTCFSIRNNYILGTESVYLSVCVYLSAYLSIYLSIYLSVCLSVCLWLYSPFLDLDHIFSFLILYTVCKTPWTGDQPVARPILTHRINAQRYLCLECDSNSWSPCLSGRRQFML